jgi:hypothetical protein
MRTSTSVFIGSHSFYLFVANIPYKYDIIYVYVLLLHIIYVHTCILRKKMDQLRTMNLTAIWRPELNFYLIKVITSVAHLKSMEGLETYRS